jgi:hypothetical protein
MLESMPRVLFALLPVFGLIVALFYRGRHYRSISISRFTFTHSSFSALSTR